MYEKPCLIPTILFFDCIWSYYQSIHSTGGSIAFEEIRISLLCWLETICMKYHFFSWKNNKKVSKLKCQNLFSEDKIKISSAVQIVPFSRENKYISKCRLLNFFPSMLSDKNGGDRSLPANCIWMSSTSVINHTWINKTVNHHFPARADRTEYHHLNPWKYWPLQANRCLRTSEQSTGSDSVRACAKSHLSICSPLIQSKVSNAFVIGQRRSRSDCADAQSDPGPRYSHMPKYTFLHGMANVVFTYLIVPRK